MGHCEPDVPRAARRSSTVPRGLATPRRRILLGQANDVSGQYGYVPGQYDHRLCQADNMYCSTYESTMVDYSHLFGYIA
jgi:hypothetical protein